MRFTISLLLIFLTQLTFGQATSFSKTWSTYYCNGYSFVKMSTVDKHGYIYIWLEVLKVAELEQI